MALSRSLNRKGAGLMVEGHNHQEFIGHIREAGTTIVLELRGEWDILAASVVSGRLDALTGTRSPDLVLDVRAVTFMDAAGLGLLCRARRRARKRGGRLRLTGVTDDGWVARLLRMAALTGEFEIVAEEITGATCLADCVAV
ncbi:STAS domain-containing protein [Streptomyces chattanoogensis]|uniref:STAS domain-containing protein n=1 Tax=Streptomyces chattanoogensis TaxID=66876 RepID=UPI003675FAC0